MSVRLNTLYQTDLTERWTRLFIHGGLSPPAMYILRAHTPTASSPSVSVYIFLALRASLSELSLAPIARVHKERAVCSL